MVIENFPGVDAPEPAASPLRSGVKQEFFGKDGFGFFDFLDMINPLQHIPILSGLYRKLTGDEISPGARLVGGGLFGGPIGFAAALANVAVEEASGNDIGGHIFALVDGDGEGPELIPAHFASAAKFGEGAASEPDVSPLKNAPNSAAPLGTAAAARRGLFTLALDVPAAAYEDDSSRSEIEAPAVEDAFDRLTGGHAVRAVDLSAAQLVQILAQFQRGTGASPSLAAPLEGAWPSQRPGSLPFDPAPD